MYSCFVFLTKAADLYILDARFFLIFFYSVNVYTALYEPQCHSALVFRHDAVQSGTIQVVNDKITETVGFILTFAKAYITVVV